MIYGFFVDDLNLGERVRYYRQKRNLTQKQLAQWVGCSVGVISRLECHNSIPAADVLLSICRELDVSPVCIFRSSKYLNTLFACVAGKTIYTPEGNMMNFKIVRVSSDFKLDKNKCFCVEHEGRILLANKGSVESSELCLCSEYSSGKCVLVKRSELDADENKYFIIAGITDDITDISMPITM